MEWGYSSVVTTSLSFSFYVSCIKPGAMVPFLSAFSSSTCCYFFLFCRRFIRRSMRHTNNGGATNVMTAVFPRILYKGASSWRNACTQIFLSMLKKSRHRERRKVIRPSMDVLWCRRQGRIMMMGSFTPYSRVDADHLLWSSCQPRRKGFRVV